MPGRRSILSANDERRLKVHADLARPCLLAPLRYTLSVQRFDLFAPASRRIHCNHIKFDLALDNDKTFQETSFGFSALEDVRAVYFQRFIRAELSLIELGYRSGSQSWQSDCDLYAKANRLV